MTIKLWDTTSGQLRQTLRGQSEVIVLSYSPNGKTLASASMATDTTIKLWDAISGQLKQTLNGHNAHVTDLSYSPHGILTSASYDGIKLWTPAILKTQALFYKYNPQYASDALKFLWQMDLDQELLTLQHKVRTPALYPTKEGYYYDENERRFFPLLTYPAKGQTKTDQLIQWLEEEEQKAAKKDVSKNTMD